jgi:hypothetical protein
MVSFRPTENDYQTLLDLLADMTETAITSGARSALQDAKRARIRGGDAIRIIEFPSDADCHSLRRRLRDVLESGQPTGMQKRALGRLVPLLAALR